MPQIVRGGKKALEMIDIRWGWSSCRPDMPQIARGGEKAVEMIDIRWGRDSCRPDMPKINVVTG